MRSTTLEIEEGKTAIKLTVLTSEKVEITVHKMDCGLLEKPKLRILVPRHRRNLIADFIREL